MKQSYASAGKAPRRRVHSPSGIAAIAEFGLPPPRIVIGYLAHQTQSGAEPCLSFLVLECCSLECCSRRRPQLDTVRHLTGRDQTPQRYQDLPHQHGRRLATDTDPPAEHPHHRRRPGTWSTLEPLGTCLLDRADLLTDQCQPCHVAPELLDDVCRQARALRGPQTCQTLWSLTQMWLESPDPETGKRTLHAVDDA